MGILLAYLIQREREREREKRDDESVREMNKKACVKEGSCV